MYTIVQEDILIERRHPGHLFPVTVDDIGLYPDSTFLTEVRKELELRSQTTV